MGFQLSWLLSLTVLFGCGGESQHTSSGETAAELEKNSANAKMYDPYHSSKGWQGPVWYYIANSAPEEVERAALHAARTWNDGVGFELLSFKGRLNKDRSVGLSSSLLDQITVIYFEVGWTESTGKSAFTLATTVWENRADDPRIIDRGDIILNGETYLFLDASKKWKERPLQPVADAETVLLHEFGHLLGLGHSSALTDPDSIMLPRTKIGEGHVNREISPIDLENLIGIYGGRTL